MATLNYFNVVDLPGTDWQITYSITDDNGGETVFTSQIFPTGQEALDWAQAELDYSNAMVAKTAAQIASSTSVNNFHTVRAQAITDAMAPYI